MATIYGWLAEASLSGGFVPQFLRLQYVGNIMN